MTCALVVVQGKGRSCTSMCLRHGCIHARRGIARYSKELQRRHVPPQACHSRCSVIHLVGIGVRPILPKVALSFSREAYTG
ncbi:MAG: hypothetical protein P8179_09035 [Candidatus Thiodiazotropha sp.]